MDETAIREIQQTAIDAQGKRVPGELANRLIALPENYRVHDLEKYGPSRFRLHGEFKTSCIPDFAAYVKARKNGVGQLFVADTTRMAMHFFNIGTAEEAGHADDIAMLALPDTAAFAAMLVADKTRFQQRDLIEWLEDWQGNIVPLDGVGGAVALSAAIAAIRSVTIAAKQERTNTVGDFNTRKTAMDDIEARGAVALPAGFRFRCAPSLGLPERDFYLRLQVNTSTPDKEPTFTLRIAQREAQNEAIVADFKKVLAEAMGESVPLLVGFYSP